ncbi:MAG: aldose epimerase family protein [Bilophila wadsworthia]|uniref:aldose epimerase family protein n=1 Tax=Bilophila wadsworthia TaxID=35833 RepID=UPI003A2788CA
MQRVERSVFGELNGKPIHLFRLSNANGMVAELLEFGGRIKALCIPDGQGGLDNMSVGYDTFEPYHARFNPWLGALLGRTASRVTGARFQIDGKTYNLSASGPAGSNMHGGFVGFDSRVWTGEADSDATGATLKLTYLSPDGEEGYPGNASVTVTYRLDDDNRFHMDWEAVTDAPTIIDMSSHVYLNLNGFKNRDIMNEYLKVNASYYLEKDATGTPTGNFIPVEGTVFDLRTPKLMEELSQGAVYNPIMALDGEGGTLREVAEVSIPEKGRSYTLHTTARALQVYNAYNMASFYTSRGLESPFAPAPGLAIEPQNYPNAINIPSMPSPILRPGETYSERQFFAFKW